MHWMGISDRGQGRDDVCDGHYIKSTTIVVARRVF